MRYRHTLTAVALTLGFVLAGCGDGDTAGTDGGAAPSGTAQQSFNETDVEFAQGMIPHHQQAIAMAQMASGRAPSPDVQQLAADIEAAQGPEIETMTGWLESWGEDVPDDTSGMDGGMSMEDMAGMMSTEDMTMLEATSGAAFDEMFLTMMIEHHEGAIEMARIEQTDGEYAEAIALAEKIESDQTAEIDTMRKLLGS